MKTATIETTKGTIRLRLFDDKALRALLGRRDKLVEKLERLIEEHGEATVLSP